MSPLARGVKRADLGAERGSASIWVLLGSLLVLLAALAVVARTEAVLARHRAGAAADLAALAAAGQIGVAADHICGSGRSVAAANGATLRSCSVELAADGRSGSVTVQVTVSVRLPFVGRQLVTSSARAARLPA